MTTYHKALRKLPAKVRKAIAFVPRRFLPLHGNPDDDAPVRLPREVARRALVLLGVVAFVGEQSRTDVNAWLRREGLWDDVTDQERGLLLARASAPDERVRLSWRMEALWVLLWALGRIRDLGPPTQECDPQRIACSMPYVDEPTSSFVEEATLRPTGEVLDQLSLVFQIRSALHHAWMEACGKKFPAGEVTIVRRDPTKSPPPPLGGVHEDVALQRHWALNWLVYYCDAEWDDVGTDT